MKSQEIFCFWWTKFFIKMSMSISLCLTLKTVTDGFLCQGHINSIGKTSRLLHYWQHEELITHQFFHDHVLVEFCQESFFELRSGNKYRIFNSVKTICVLTLDKKNCSSDIYNRQSTSKRVSVKSCQSERKIMAKFSSKPFQGKIKYNAIL